MLIIPLAVLDFLCIHPFADGNGRVSRLLTLMMLYHFGYDVGRYISLERIIEQSKERYYETLQISSRNWHDGKHDPWPYVNYLLYTLKELYAEWLVVSNDGDLPERFSEPFVLAQEVSGREARLLVKQGASEMELFRKAHGVEVHGRPLNLEEMFPVLVGEKAS